jgi:TetR/AcrR family transcriptional regulator
MPMGKRSVPAPDVRQRVLEEATRLMAANGFGATSLQDVADAVGVTKQSVLYHFPSKEELRKAILEALLAGWKDVVPRLLIASTQSGLAKFDAVMQNLVEFFASDPDRARLLLREMLDRPEEMREIIDRHVRPWVEVVTGHIRLGQEGGQIQADVDAESYVVNIIGMALAATATMHTIGSALAAKKKAPGERIVKELVRAARTSLFRESYLEHQTAKRRGVS